MHLATIYLSPPRLGAAILHTTFLSNYYSPDNRIPAEIWAKIQSERIRKNTSYSEIDPSKLENTGEKTSVGWKDYRYMKAPAHLKCDACRSKDLKCISFSQIEVKDNIIKNYLFQCNNCNRTIGHTK